ncbi:MAG TPA: tRNA (pseudouridine(54)-N(1))-methyltransferase TrmY [Candidatus Nanoarchaeia archaeon]|nr:tRNA (pseudouridine(54)-N(1))-methyltransferase TrmY [Candidatus Nanoarchaeia archaeon]
MKTFILYSRQGQTNGNFTNLRDAGRMDIVANCLNSAFFLSHALRKDVVIYLLLTGPPNPPICIRVQGDLLYDMRCDEFTAGEILKKVLNGGSHPGFELSKQSLQELIKFLSRNNQIFVLEEKGELIDNIKIKENCVFVIGDQVGLPKKEESFVLRHGKKISLGRTKYLATDCITILNYYIDKIL